MMCNNTHKQTPRKNKFNKCIEVHKAQYQKSIRYIMRIYTRIIIMYSTLINAQMPSKLFLPSFVVGLRNHDRSLHTPEDQTRSRDDNRTETREEAETEVQLYEEDVGRSGAGNSAIRYEVIDLDIIAPVFSCFIIIIIIVIIIISITVEQLSNDHPHQRPSLLYDHI